MSQNKNESDFYASDVKKAFTDNDITKLEELYDQLSEEEDINKAKAKCLSIYNDKTLNCIIDVIKSKDSTTILKYYGWHFLQLTSSCSIVKESIQDDFKLLPALMNLHTFEFENSEQTDSLHSISLNYLIVMLGGANDQFYNNVAESGAISFVHNMLTQASLSSDDNQIEPLILLLNLLMEGTSSCKKLLMDLNFERLVAKKLKDRQDPDDNLLNVSQMTHQKLLLLTSEKQTFVETFRKGFEEEAKKQLLYQDAKEDTRTCSFLNCATTYTASFKRCSRCKSVIYCSKDCQIKDWKRGHSKICATSYIKAT